MCLSMPSRTPVQGLFPHREGANRHNAADQSGKIASSDATGQVNSDAQMPGASNRRLWHKAEAHPNQLVPMVVQLNVDIVLQSSRSRSCNYVIMGLVEGFSHCSDMRAKFLY